MNLLNRVVPNWPILSRLLDEALDLPPCQRDAWLADLPSGYAALKPELEILLARDSDLWSASFLESLPTVGSHTGGAFDGPAPAKGDTIGPWHLLRKIGEGVKIRRKRTQILTQRFRMVRQRLYTLALVSRLACSGGARGAHLHQRSACAPKTEVTGIASRRSYRFLSESSR